MSDGDKIQLPFQSVVPVRSAALHYTTDTGLRSERTWQTLPAEVSDGIVTAPRPPLDANTWFIALTNDRGAMVTSAIQLQGTCSPLSGVQP